MYCSKCGKPNADNARFCASCGAPMEATQAAPQPAQPMAAHPVKAQPMEEAQVMTEAAAQPAMTQSPQVVPQPAAPKKKEGF